MLRGCTSLKSLPDSFSISSRATNVEEMFYNCPSLTSLPATLSLSTLPDKAKGTALTMLALPDATEKVVTVYAGDDLSMLSVDGTDAVAYWSDNYDRVLCTAGGKPDAVKSVSFVVSDPVTGASKAWTTVTAEGGVLERPVDPVLYGYAFDGWYRDNSFTTDSKVVFDENNSMQVDADAVLYGRYMLQTRYQIPTKAKVKIDPTGKIAPADVQMRSFTPVPLTVSRVTCEATNAASEIIDPADLQKIAVTLTAENDLWPTYVAVGKGAGLSDAFALPTAQPGAPGVLNYSIGLDIPDASVVKLWRDGWSTDLVLLKYTVEPAA